MSHMTAAEIQLHLGVHPHTLRKWIQRGHIVKIGRNRYDLRSVLERLHGKQAPTQEET